MKLLERIVLQLFPGLKDRLEECEYNAKAAAQLSSTAIAYAYKALERADEGGEPEAPEVWLSRNDDVGNN